VVAIAPKYDEPPVLMIANEFDMAEVSDEALQHKNLGTLLIGHTSCNLT